MATTVELLELTADWTNPDHDRRVKYGAAGVAVLKAGQRMILRRWTRKLKGVPITYTSLKAIGNAFDVSEDHTVAVILAQTKPVEPGSWKEWCLLRDDVGGDYTNREVLEEVWKQPELRPALEAAFHAVMKRLDEAEG